QGREYAPAARMFCAAAQHAATLSAHAETARLARRGLEALSHVAESPEREQLELQLLVMVGVALIITEGYASEGARAAYTRARTICRKLGTRRELFPILWGLWGYHLSVGQGAEAIEIAQQLRELAADGRAADRVRAAWALGTTAIFAGRPREGVELLDEGLRHYDRADDQVDRYLYGHDAGQTCRVFGAWGRCLLGRPDEAMEQIDAACREAAALSHPQSTAFTYMFAAVIHHFRGDPEPALARAEEAYQIADREGMPQFREWNRSVIGWARHALGQAEEGIADATHALAALRAIGSQVALGYYGGILADMLLRSGQPGRALDLADEMLDLVRRTGEDIQRPELLRIRAGALAAFGRREEAIAAARESVQVAERQQSLLHELRALLMLARLRRGTPELDDVLRDLYAALTAIKGGLSTRDVIDVRTTLELV
ncbi:MAG TPA: hypothetical protein VNK41_04160, partial [Vicinamibacterales bacterium]|nr:hypothetical protein [Vicinamibacterales bacterium]